ncbi:MAG: helix-turn-helix domain-containing protein [Clostridia bacterium]|nr:helix-turn-helix domain-containing protein [Clostridia bacterium]
MSPIYMSIKDAAERYSISRSKVYELINSPESPATVKIDGRRLIPIVEYDEYIKTAFVYTEINDRPRRASVVA